MPSQLPDEPLLYGATLALNLAVLLFPIQQIRYQVNQVNQVTPCYDLQINWLTHTTRLNFCRCKNTFCCTAISGKSFTTSSCLTQRKSLWRRVYMMQHDLGIVALIPHEGKDW